MTDKIRIFVDMDGTLARFHDEQLYLERMFEKGFFAGLKPFDNAVEAIKHIIDNHPNVDVYVLSTAITTPYCITEKNAWLDKYLPNVDKEHRILMESSAGFKSLCVPGNYMYKDDNGKYHIKISENDILIDDYNKNLKGWERDGGTAIKAKNNINHRGLYGALWNGELIDVTDTADSIVERLTEIIVSREKGIEENHYNEDDEELEID